MSPDLKPVSVTILDKEYLISCTEEERDQLYNAVEFLNEKMQELKGTSRYKRIELWDKWEGQLYIYIFFHLQINNS